MAKRKTQKPDPNREFTFIDEAIPLPDSAKHMTSDGLLYIKFGQGAIELISEISSELINARRLPINPDEVSFADPVALIINNTKKDWSSDTDEGRAQELLNETRNYYRRQHQVISSDAMQIALTDNNEFTVKAKPFPEEEKEDLSNVPSWRRDKAKVRVPEPEKKLTNIYEHRLKQLSDIIEEAGFEFEFTFSQKIQGAMAAALRAIDEGESGDIDPDGFQP